MTQTVPDDELHKLKLKLYKCTWEGNYWEEGGALDLSRRVYKIEAIMEYARPLSGLSSTYYSAAGNAMAQVHKARLFRKIFWLARAIFCLAMALRFSNRLERELGMHRMMTDELVVRASILAAARRYKQALKCISEALCRRRSNEDTVVLLEIKRGEILDILGRVEDAHQAYCRAEILLYETRPTTQVRFFRSSARHSRFQGGSPENHLSVALNMAYEHNLRDQVEKIQAELRKVRSNS